MVGNSKTQAPLQVIRGFCMGAADVVPGVSGGTIALVFGIYTHLVAQVRQGARALAQLPRRRPRAAIAELGKVDWWFLAPLLLGIAAAVLTLAQVIDHFLETQPVRTAAVFFGLVAGSLWITFRLVTRWDARHLGAAASVAVAAFVLLGLRSGPAEDPALLLAFVAGAIAICAMILPGISGSFLLLMIGMYDATLDAIDERDLLYVAVFGVGAVLGLSGFSSLLEWLLARYEQLVLASLIGLMAGSLRVLWPWPEGTEGTSLAVPADDVVVPVLLAAAAAAGVVALARVAGVKDVETATVAT